MSVSSVGQIGVSDGNLTLDGQEVDPTVIFTLLAREKMSEANSMLSDELTKLQDKNKLLAALGTLKAKYKAGDKWTSDDIKKFKDLGFDEKDLPSAKVDDKTKEPHKLTDDEITSLQGMISSAQQSANNDSTLQMTVVQDLINKNNNLVSAISNAYKKNSDTASSIVRNF